MGEAKRLQSAMEYLMTYGWAILIIALVLGILWYLGVFSPQIPSGCVALPGFYCQSLVYSASLNNPTCYETPYVTANLGIYSTESWSTVLFTIVPYGQSLTDTSTNVIDEQNKDDFFYWGSLYGTYAYLPSLSSDQVASVTICINANNPLVEGQQLGVGTKLTGVIWAMYSTPTATNAVVEVAEFNTVSKQT